MSTKLEEGFDTKRPEEFWREIKRKTDPRQSNLPRCLIRSGNVIWSAAAIRKAWEDRFRLESEEPRGDPHFQRQVGMQIDEHRSNRNYEDTELNRAIEQSEIKEAVKTLKRNKSAGLDGVVNEMISLVGRQSGRLSECS